MFPSQRAIASLIEVHPVLCLMRLVFEIHGHSPSDSLQHTLLYVVNG